MQESIALALTIVAIILGPLVALWVHGKIETRRKSRDRKLVVFKELMATRAYPTRTHPRHVDALNAIQIEFYEGSKNTGRGNGNKKVLSAWRLYLDHLCDGAMMTNQKPQWDEKGNDLLAALLEKMSLALHYDFNKSDLQKNVYSPQGHVDLEIDHYRLRKYALEMMAGERPIWLTPNQPSDIKKGAPS